MTHDSQIPTLVRHAFERVDERPGDLGAVRRRARRRTRQAILSAVVASAVVVAGAAAALLTVDSPPQVPFVGSGDDVIADPQATDVETRVVHGTSVFTVPDGHSVTVLVADPQHLEGEPLWWCPGEQVFFGPFHGELFTRDGVAIVGPAARNLDRLKVEPNPDGTVRITNTVIPGAEAETSGPPDEVLGRHLTPEQVDTYRRNPQAICQDPLMPAGSALPSPSGLPRPSVFVSDSIDVGDGAQQLFENTRITVKVSKVHEDQSVSWRASCNTASAPAELNNGRLVLTGNAAVTTEGCQPRAEQQDRWLFDFFSGKPQWEQTGDVLRLRSPDGSTEIVLRRSNRE